MTRVEWNPNSSVTSSGVEKMTMPRPTDGIENKEFLEKLREYITREFLELVTGPGVAKSEVHYYDKFISGERIPLTISIEDRFVRSCQDAGLRHKEIEILKQKWFTPAVPPFA